MANAAKGFLGVPFRLHGRNPAVGLDCVGLAIASLGAIGIKAQNPQGYGLRNHTIDRWLSFVSQFDLYETDETPVHAGDIILVHSGPQQHHILIAETANSAIHAHAGLRRVVRQPHAAHPRIQARWRLAD